MKSLALLQAFGQGSAGQLEHRQQLCFFGRTQALDGFECLGGGVQQARNATPVVVNGEVFQDEHGIALGSQVVIAADNFGLEPTEGELIAATRTRYTLRRSDERAGTVHVHFPRVGFTLKKAAA